MFISVYLMGNLSLILIRPDLSHYYCPLVFTSLQYKVDLLEFLYLGCTIFAGYKFVALHSIAEFFVTYSVQGFIQGGGPGFLP